MQTVVLSSGFVQMQQQPHHHRRSSVVDRHSIDSSAGSESPPADGSPSGVSTPMAAIGEQSPADPNSVLIRCGFRPEYEMPRDVFDDILYCQKAMRTHIKVHQRLVSTLMMHNEHPDNRLRFLESEIVGIGADQNTTLNQLRASIEKYALNMSLRHVTVNRPDINFRIGTELAAKLNLSQPVDPVHVRRRHSEAELIRRLNLTNTDDYLSASASGKTGLGNVTPAVTLTAIPRQPPPIDHSARNGEQIEILLNPLDIATRTHHQPQQHATLTPVTGAAAGMLAGKPQVSLLKPRAERIGRQLVSPSSSSSVSPSPPSAVACTESLLSTMLPGVTVTPISRTTSAAPAVKPAEAPKQSAVAPSTTMNIRRMNLLNALNLAKRQKAAAAAAAAGSMRPAVRVRDSNDDKTPTVPVPTVSAASSVDGQPNTDGSSPNSNSPATSSDELSSTSTNGADSTYEPATAGGKRTAKAKKRKSPIAPAVEAKPKRPRACKSSSPESCAFDDADLAVELAEPTELSKDSFLGLFGLCTHSYKAVLIERRQERRRRHVTSTEKGDFHYGKLDLWEQQQRIAGKGGNSKRPVLYSPPRTRRGRKTAIAAAAAAALAEAEAEEAAAAKLLAGKRPTPTPSRSPSPPRPAVRKRTIDEDSATTPAAAPLVVVPPRRTYSGRGRPRKRPSGESAAVAVVPESTVSRAALRRKSNGNRTQTTEEAEPEAEADVAQPTDVDAPVNATDADELADDTLIDGNWSSRPHAHRDSMCMVCKSTNEEHVRECENCNAFYHVSCHKKPTPTTTGPITIELFCPDCFRLRLTRATNPAVTRRGKLK